MEFLRATTTVRRLLRDDTAYFRGLFWPPGFGLNSPISGNVMRLLRAFCLDEFGTGAVGERRFFLRLAGLVPVSR